MERKCDTVSEEVCNVVTEQSCKQVNDQKCSVTFEKQCGGGQEQKCTTVTETVNEEQCQDQNEQVGLVYYRKEGRMSHLVIQL